MVLAPEKISFIPPVDEEAALVSEMTAIRERVASLPWGQDVVVMDQLHQFGKQSDSPTQEKFPALVAHGFLQPNRDDPTKLEPYTSDLRRFAQNGISHSLAWGYKLLPPHALLSNIQIRRLSAQGTGFPASPRPK